jgi:hypothetical protein
MYGLGSFVKKAVKGVKNFVKSDVGKAAILGVAAFGLPGGALGMKGLISSPAVRSFIPNLLLGKEVSGSGMMGRSGDGLLGILKTWSYGKICNYVWYRCFRWWCITSFRSSRTRYK